MAIILVYSARRGILHHLPPALIVDIRRLGCSNPTESACEEADHAHLVYENEAIRWHKISPLNRNLPRDIGVNTPVFDHSEWVPFDTDKWQTVLSSGIYRTEVDGVFVEPPFESVRFSGTTDGLVQAHRPIPTNPSQVGPFADLVDGMPSGPGTHGSESA